jgi:hypothetical protein
MTTLHEATARRQAAESRWETDKSTEALKELQAAGKAEMDLVLADFDARHADDTDEQFEEIAKLEFEVVETKRAIDLPAGHQSMMDRPTRVTAWKQAQDALTAAVQDLSDDRLAAYGVYRRRFK